MKSKNSNKQFVIQEHKNTNGIHWDLMLECDGQLWTWRIGVHPSKIHNGSITAERIFDHSLKFITYEGPVQDGTGSVQIVDKGLLRFQQIAPQNIVFHLEGKILEGAFTFHRKRTSLWTLQKNENKRFI